MICRKSDSESIELCSKLLKEEKVVIIPTDTVYGFSGVINKTDFKIRSIKGRAENKPFIILISEPEEINSISAQKLPSSLLNYWPGALTVIVRKKDNSNTTVAVRCPGDEWLRNIISLTGSPIYSTSVNRSSFPVLNSIEEIKREFESEVSLIVDDGDKIGALPSTIVRYDGKISVVRQGSLIIES
ncbi:MAG: L-threonylcarbamoyladenylate synthase [Treponema sp.]